MVQRIITIKAAIIIFLFLSLTIYFHPAFANNNNSFFSSSHILSYYGNPYTPKMGILGDHPPEKLASLIKSKAAEYDSLNNEKGVIAAFHVVYATVQPRGELLYVNKDIIAKYIKIAKENRMLVFLDHQIGRHSVEKAAADLLIYAEHEHVHFAIDPEWRTDIPGKKIGSVSGHEINRIQELIQMHSQKNQIANKKILVLHQFSYKMLTERQAIKVDYPKIELVHNMDGFGNPSLKKDSYKLNSQATNMPLKGFKLFYPDRKSWSYDKPLMSPAEVLSLNPRPVLIMYQ